MTKDEALKQALEALEELVQTGQTYFALDCGYEAIAAIKEALALPAEQELEGDCAPNHLCNGAFVHKPTNELCSKCGKE